MAKKLDWMLLVTKNGQFCEQCQQYHDSYVDGICWATTFGLLEKYGHTEFELLIDLDERIIGHILNSLGLRVAAGETFKDGDIVTDILTIPIKLMEREDDTGRFLRVIIPDQNGKWPEDEGCEYPFNLQTRPLSELKKEE